MLSITDYSGKDEEHHKKHPDYLTNLSKSEVGKFVNKMNKDAIKDEETYFVLIEMH